MNDHQPTDDIQYIPSTSPDLKSQLAKKLQELAPEAITDGKVDTKKLKELLDDDSADDSERFGLFWPGKKRAMRAAQEPTTATLKPVKEESKDWDTTENIFIEGDNLEVLKVLQKHYHNKIKMIYIDPPYNTGKDFVYPDNFKEGLQSYLEFTKQVDEDGRKLATNSDTEGRYHSNWLNMMYPRLKLARNLLTNDGVIFISIDDNEIDNLRKVCNEIFGESNFVAQIVWEKMYTTKNDSKQISDSHEYVLCYARSIDTNPVSLLPRTKEADARYLNPDNDPRGPWKSIPLSAKGERSRGRFPVVSPTTGKVFELGPDKHWLYSQENVEAYILDNRIWFGKDGNSTPNVKRFLTEVQQGLKARTLWRFSDVGSNDSAKREIKALFGDNPPFDFPKPVTLIIRMLLLGAGRDGIVLDFFSGSGTTAHAVMQLNAEDGGSRKHIQVQLPEPTNQESEAYKTGYPTITSIAQERIRRAGEKVEADYSDRLAERDTPLDIGFKLFKLADTNFTKWKTSSDTDGDKLQQHLLTMRDSSNDSATEEELLTELLIKLGVSLTTKIESQTISDLSIWKVGDNLILAYLNEHVKPSLDQLIKIAEIEPTKLIILEDAFKGDDELKTNLSQICKTNKIELWTV